MTVKSEAELGRLTWMCVWSTDVRQPPALLLPFLMLLLLILLLLLLLLFNWVILADAGL
jgi:hypothetical protein